MRRVDTLAFIGLFLLFAGAGTFLGKYSALPLWVVWLVGPLLWYLGFAVLISWMLWRLFVPAPAAARQEETEVQPVHVSNFLEHDYETPLEPRMRKVPVYGTLVILILLSSLFIAQSYAADTAAAVFTSKCVMCHGADGKGDTPVGKKMGIRDLTSADVQKMSDEELITVTTKGKNKMPGYENKLSAAQIKDIVAYIRQLAKGK